MPSTQKSLGQKFVSLFPDLRTEKMRQVDQRNYERAVERGRLEHWKEMLENEQERRQSGESGQTLVSHGS